MQNYWTSQLSSHCQVEEDKLVLKLWTNLIGEIEVDVGN